METLEDNGELVFLYQLIDGVTNNSHAVFTAQRAGVLQHIIDRVSQVIQHSSIQRDQHEGGMK